MENPKPLKLGDACPVCGSELVPALVPTDEQRRRLEDRELREPLPTFADTMSAQQRTEHGALYQCVRCGYVTRFPLGTVDSKTSAAA